MTQIQPGEGSSGRGKRYKDCFVCYFYSKKKSAAEYGCVECGVPICVKVHDGLDLCWKRLHTNADIMSKVERKLKNKMTKHTP